VLGGLRVVLFKDEIGIFHATLAQLFFALVCALALVTSRWWVERRSPDRRDGAMIRKQADSEIGVPVRRLFLITTILIFLQLVLGATMRHQHAGLAISDFPLAHGRLWPAMDADSVARYNQQRIEVVAAHPITAFQIGLQMAHRLMALVILAGVGLVAWRTRASNPPLRRLARFWVVLILIQAALGAWTIWSNKAADVATAHVLVGALSLVTGTLGCIIAFRRLTGIMETKPAAVAFDPTPDQPLRGNPATAANQ
jgi:cytochrome c oxidase assembly protein subunit 15